jgi:hypothetical protein
MSETHHQCLSVPLEAANVNLFESFMLAGGALNQLTRYDRVPGCEELQKLRTSRKTQQQYMGMKRWVRYTVCFDI